jgi:lysophospholipase L1-like esterase
LENYRQEYAELLEAAIELAGGKANRVFVLSIPDWSATPFAVNSGRDLAVEAAAIAAYNQAKQEITLARGVRFFDITPSTLTANLDSSLVAVDGLHPSAKLYSIWTEQIVDGVQQLLEAGSECD